MAATDGTSEDKAFTSPDVLEALEAKIRSRVASRKATRRKPARSDAAKVKALDVKLNTLAEPIATAPDAVVDALLAKLSEFQSQRDTIAEEIAVESRINASDSEIDDEQFVAAAMRELWRLAETLKTDDRASFAKT